MVWPQRLGLTIALAASTPAAGQTFSDPGQQLLNEQKRERNIERLERSAPGQAITVAPAAAPAGDKVCFAIQDIRVEGSSKLGADVVADIVAPFRKRCLGQQAIGALMSELTNAYVKRGFITSRVYIPGQNLKSGTLRLSVVEGRIEAFEYVIVDENGAARPAPDRRVRTLFQSVPGDVLQLRELEQGLDQVNRLPSSQAQIDLKPGADVGGTVVVIRERQADLFRGRAGFDTFGSRATGRLRKRATIELDDVASLANQTTATVVSSENTNALSASVSQPYGPWTLNLSGSYSESGSPVSDVAELFSQTGGATVRLDRMVYRDADTKVGLNAGLLANLNQRFLNTAFLEPQKRAAVRFGVTVEQRFETDVLAFDGGMSWAVPGLLDEGRRSLGARFWKLDGSATWLKPLPFGMRLLSTVNAQGADRPLKSTDQLSIGGWDTVRGYRDVELNGEVGASMRNDLYLPWPEPLKRLASLMPGPAFDAWRPQWQPYLFSDLGMVRNIGLAETHALWGAGAGVQIRAPRFDVDLTVATPLIGAFEARAGGVEAFATLSLKLF